MRSLDQERAEFAWEKVGSNPSGDYVNLAKAAPALIMQNGLMQTLAFYQGKGDKHHTDLANHIMSWLHRRGLVSAADFTGVMKALHGSDSASYMQATSEALEILRWIRQYATARQKAAGQSRGAA